MTHPTLGYANFRFPGDDAVHMPATPTATLTVACRAGNDPATVAAAYEVDAPVDCPDCAQALVADWWMALMENERRTGETTSLTGTLDDVAGAMQRLLSQTDAVVEETLLGGGASLVEQPRPQPAEVDGGVRWSGFPWEHPGPMPLPLKGIVTGNADDMLAMARQLEAADEAMARQMLAGSPLTALKRYQIRHDEWTMDVTPSLAKEGPWQGEAPLIDPGAERVRRIILEGEWLPEEPRPEHDSDDDWHCVHCGHNASDGHPSETSHDGPTHCLECPECRRCPERVRKAIEAAQRELVEHPFDETWLANAKGLPSDSTAGPANVIVHGDDTITEVFDDGPSEPDHNWCHVHNRPSLPDSELCKSCHYTPDEDPS